MQFLKKHYEKVILSIVLLGLAVAAAFMPIKVASEQRAIEEQKSILIHAPAKPLKPVDTSTNEAALTRLKGDLDFNLSGDHNVFNPVKWQKKQDGGVIKATEVGLNSVEVTKITPLNLVVTLEEITGEPGNNRYQISLLNETEKAAKKTTRIVSTNSPKAGNLFTLKEVHGPSEAPVRLILQLGTNDKNLAVITNSVPFVQVVGYSADLKAELFNNFVRKNLRVKDQITLDEETYNIVAISRDEVVLSARSNAKQTTLKYNAAAAR